MGATFWQSARLPRGPSRIQRARQAEKAWQAQVVAAARLRGWATYHTYDSRRSTAGYPDLTLVRPPRVLFVECKTATGVVSPAQRQWLDALAQCPGVETYTLRPADWPLVDRILA
jgi:hypothetical protein